MEPNIQTIAEALCKKSFIDTLDKACEEAGGLGWSACNNGLMTLNEFIKLFAVNGIRVYYEPIATIDAQQEQARRLLQAAKEYQQVLAFTNNTDK